ncbi:hypothetical protein HK096_003989, partial [Nowakowskiella sp. JEL0078]
SLSENIKKPSNIGVIEDDEVENVDNKPELYSRETNTSSIFARRESLKNEIDQIHHEMEQVQEVYDEKIKSEANEIIQRVEEQQASALLNLSSQFKIDIQQMQQIMIAEQQLKKNSLEERMRSVSSQLRNLQNDLDKEHQNHKDVNEKIGDMEMTHSIVKSVDSNTKSTRNFISKEKLGIEGGNKDILTEENKAPRDLVRPSITTKANQDNFPNELSDNIDRIYSEDELFELLNTHINMPNPATPWIKTLFPQDTMKISPLRKIAEKELETILLKKGVSQELIENLFTSLKQSRDKNYRSISELSSKQQLSPSDSKSNQLNPTQIQTSVKIPAVESNPRPKGVPESAISIFSPQMMTPLVLKAQGVVDQGQNFQTHMSASSRTFSESPIGISPPGAILTPKSSNALFYPGLTTNDQKPIITDFKEQSPQNSIVVKVPNQLKHPDLQLPPRPPPPHQILTSSQAQGNKTIINFDQQQKMTKIPPPPSIPKPLPKVPSKSMINASKTTADFEIFPSSNPIEDASAPVDSVKDSSKMSTFLQKIITPTFLKGQRMVETFKSAPIIIEHESNDTKTSSSDEYEDESECTSEIESSKSQVSSIVQSKEQEIKSQNIRKSIATKEFDFEASGILAKVVSNTTGSSINVNTKTSNAEKNIQSIKQPQKSTPPSSESLSEVESQVSTEDWPEGESIEETNKWESKSERIDSQRSVVNNLITHTILEESDEDESESQKNVKEKSGNHCLEPKEPLLFVKTDQEKVDENSFDISELSDVSDISVDQVSPISQRELKKNKEDSESLEKLDDLEEEIAKSKSHSGIGNQ